MERETERAGTRRQRILFLKQVQYFIIFIEEWNKSLLADFQRFLAELHPRDALHNEAAMKAPTERFSDRVEDYVKHRPTYPPEVIETLRRECGLAAGSAVADIGAGTGIFSALLLAAGWQVRAVEPNAPMRQAAEARLGGLPGFSSVAGSAEQTGLPSASVDLVTAAQAFHWFRPEETRREFARILKPGGWVALVWNQRATSTPLQAEYEAMLLAYSAEYANSGHRKQDDSVLARFFSPSGYRKLVVENGREQDLASLKGLLRSSSYAPKEGTPGFAPMMAELERIVARHAVAGRVRFVYETRVFLGRVE